MSDNNPSCEDPFGQIADEFVEAFRQGKYPSIEEFIRRYPEHADEIREILPALVLMEKARSAEDDPAQRRQSRASAVTPLQQLGDYVILREIGRGGMGVVYEAQQLSLGRHVALKLLPSHALLDGRQLARFQREARSAAKLHHTNIVPVFGVGEQDGLHYYVMQFIQGLGLDAVLDELRRLRQPSGKQEPTLGDAPSPPTNVNPNASAADVARGLLSGEFRKPDQPGTLTTAPGDPVAKAAAPPARAADTSAAIHLPGQSEGSTLSDSGRPYWQSVARIGMQVADALGHAASQGILHRDVKPSNLLLDETGNVWVTDFGLAKADGDGDLTHTGDVVGTLRYLAPERFSGQGDVRSDVYSLGLTLYEMLTMRTAFGEADRNRLVKQVMHDEPVRPRKLNPAVPRDLETVVLKAIARDPAQRYQTPAAMAEDLKRFVEDMPVRARRVSETEKLWRWCRRNPLPAGLLAGIVLVFLAGNALVFWQWRAAEMARANEKSQRNAAARQAAGLLLDRGIEDARNGEPARALHLFVQALRTLPADDPEAAPLERVIRANLSAWAETVPALEHVWPDRILDTDVAFSPEGERIAIAVGKDEIQCFRTDTGRPVGPLLEIPDGKSEAIVFAPDGRSLWVASPGHHTFDAKTWTIHRFDLASGRPIQAPVPTTGPVERLAVTPDGRYLVGAVLGLHPEDRGPKADAEGSRKWRTASLMVWETASGRVVRKVDVNGDYFFSLLGLSPDGKSVTAWVAHEGDKLEGLTFAVDGTESPKSLGLHPWQKGELPRVNFQNDMRTALVIQAGQVRRWSVTNPGVLGPGLPAPFRMTCNAAAPDGRAVISRDEGRVFDAGAWPPRASGVRFAHTGWQRDQFRAEQYSPDGRLLATWGDVPGSDRRLWRLPRPHSRPSLPRAEFARVPERKDDYAFSQFDSRGVRAILHAWGHAHVGHREVFNVRLVDVATGAVRDTSVHHSSFVRDVVFTPDGRYLATGSNDGTARVWEAATGRPASPPLPHVNYVATVAFSPDGNTLAAGDFGPAGLIKLWDWRTGKEVRAPLRHDDIVLNVSFSPDGRYLAAVKARDWSSKPEFLVWDVASGTPVVRVSHNGNQDDVTNKLGLAARFRPDGRAIAIRDDNGVLRLWEVPSGALLGERTLDGKGVTRFSPDGRVVAAAANLGVRLLDGDTLDPLPGGFLPHPDPLRDVAFSPDGAFLLTGHLTGSAQLWDVTTRKPVGPPAVLIGPILAVAFTPDGKTCLCVAADGTVRRWPVPAPFAEPDLSRLAERVALMTGQRMDDSQGLDHVPADEWRALRAKLAGDGSTVLTPPRADADWHDAVATDAEQDGDAFGAEWHLDRLAALRPDDWTIPARRGRILAAAGRRDEAAAAYAKARRLAPSARVLSDWVRARASDDEAAGRMEAALWNLDRAVALTPDDWTVYAARALLAYQAGQQERARSDIDEVIRRGADDVGTIVRIAEEAVRSGDWKRAAALFASLAGDVEVPTLDRHLQAVACLKAGDPASYRAACASIAKRLPPVGPELTPREARNAARVFTLGPNATDDWTKPLAWIDHGLVVLAEDEKAGTALKALFRTSRHAYLNTRGAVLYRAGRFEDAAKVLREAMSLHPGGGAFEDWLFLALAEHRLGHADAAKQAAARAREAKAAAKPDSVWVAAENDLLAAELDAALPPTGK